MKKKVISETGILFVDKKIFGDHKEHEYDCECQDGTAICSAVEDGDPKKIKVKYPMLKTLTRKQKEEILLYRGLYDLTTKDVHYGDVMMVYGVIDSVVC